MDPWHLVLEGKYQEAVDEMEKQMAPPARPSSSEYANRAHAYLCLRKYDAAAHDYEDLMSTIPNSGHGYVGYAVCQWCQRKPEEAIAFWKRALEAVTTDAAGGVKTPAMLLYAGLRTHDPDLQKFALGWLRRKARTKQAAANWPGPLAGFLLGRLSREEVHLALTASAGVPILHERYQCQAHFYQGVKGLLEGEPQVFQDEMRAAAKSWYGYLEFEYYLANWEVDQEFSEEVAARHI